MFADENTEPQVPNLEQGITGTTLDDGVADNHRLEAQG